MSGKWDDPNVPKSGWTCLGVNDLDEPCAICNMCEVQIIRYVHHMIHPDYQEPLYCGCICAGKMENNIPAAQKRERKLKSVMSNRKYLSQINWPDISRKGNPYKKYKGFVIVLSEREYDRRWTSMIMKNDIIPPIKQYSNTYFAKIEDAKLWGIDKINEILNEEDE